jgi:predicted kinase
MQRDMGGRVVERDDIRYMLFGRYTDVDEKLVTEVQNDLIDQGLRMQENVFVSDMNLRNQYVTRLWEKAQTYGAAFEIVDLTNVPLHTCIKRNEDRIKSGKRGVSHELIKDLHTRFIKGKEYPLPFTVPDAKLDKQSTVREPYARNPFLPNAIIVDIDGTLARMVDRGPFDEHFVMNDELIEYVERMVYHAAYAECAIIFMSGRTDACKEDTTKWLMKHLDFLDPDFMVTWELHMRRSVEDRGRPDDDVKYDLFNAHVRDRFNVLYVIDDRDKVVKMWRDIGLVCAQVAYGNF